MTSPNSTSPHGLSILPVAITTSAHQRAVAASSNGISKKKKKTLIFSDQLYEVIDTSKPPPPSSARSISSQNVARRNSDTSLINKNSQHSFLRIPFTSKLRNTNNHNSNNKMDGSQSNISPKSPDFTFTPNMHTYDAQQLSPNTPQSPLSPTNSQQIQQKHTFFLKLGLARSCSNNNQNVASTTAANNTMSEQITPLFVDPESKVKSSSSKTMAQYFNNKFSRKRHSVSILKFNSAISTGSSNSNSNSTYKLDEKSKSRGSSPKPANSLVSGGDGGGGEQLAPTSPSTTSSYRFMMPFKLKTNRTPSPFETLSSYDRQKKERSKSAPINQRQKSTSLLPFANTNALTSKTKSHESEMKKNSSAAALSPLEAVTAACKMCEQLNKRTRMQMNFIEK